MRGSKHFCCSLLSKLSVATLTFFAPISQAASATDVPIRQTAQVATSDQATSPDIAPSDVYVRTLLVQDELELIRLEMGKPHSETLEIRVRDAEPREVFFQALTLFRKANRLSFELTRERTELPTLPQGEIRPAQVRVVVNAALERLQRVKTKLAIVEQSKARPRDETKAPADVFLSIVQANRQLNLLLDQQFSASDVFQQVTLAVGYTSLLLARFPETRMPEAPVFERRKRPADVYRRLVGCFGQVRAIMQRSGLNTLKLETDHEDVTSSDIYDIAALIVSELSFIYTRLNNALPPPEAYYPGRKFLSDVYQRAGLLDAFLTALQAAVDTDPVWLRAKD